MPLAFGARAIAANPDNGNGRFLPIGPTNVELLVLILNTDIDGGECLQGGNVGVQNMKGIYRIHTIEQNITYFS